MMSRTVCTECLEAALRAFPVSQTIRAVVGAGLRFFSMLKEEQQPPRQCDECGRLVAVTFQYPVPESRDWGPCIHCGLPELHPIHDDGAGGGRHVFTSSSSKETPP